MAERLAGVQKGGGKPLVDGVVGIGQLGCGYGISHQLADLGLPGATVLLPWDKYIEFRDLVKGDPVSGAALKLGGVTPAAQKPRLDLIIDGPHTQRVLEGSVAESASMATDAEFWRRRASPSKSRQPQLHCPLLGAGNPASHQGHARGRDPGCRRQISALTHGFLRESG